MADLDHVTPVVGTLFNKDAVPLASMTKFLDNVTDWNLFSVQKPYSLQETIRHTHTCLGSAKHRVEGLLLLERIISQCNASVFTKNVRTWINLLIQTLQSHCPARHHHLTCHVISLLLRECKGLAELSREISTSFLPQILPLLLAATDEWASQSIGCINTCLRLYPGACGTFKGKIENFILPYLDKEYPVEEAIRSFSLLAGCGGSGNRGIKYREGWSRQCQRLLTSLCQVITELYTDLDQDLPPVGENCLPLSKVPDEEPMRTSRLQCRYQMLSQCMEHLLREDFAVAAKVPADWILTVIYKTLAVNNKMLLSKCTTERLLLAYIIPSLHTSTLKLLSALILCMKKALMPFSSSILSQLTQTLAWTRANICTPGLEKPYSRLRETVYCVSCDWLKCLGSCDVGLSGSEFILELLSDVQPEVENIKLNSSKLNNNSKDQHGPSTAKKQKKGGGYQEISQGQGLAKKANHTANNETCYMALEALRWILHTNGCTVKTKTMQEIVRCLMEVLALIQQSCDSPPPPYSHPKCREGLYRAVVALVLVPHPECPPPVHLAFRLVQNGLRDFDLEVSSYCREALNVIEIIAHPRAPCLQPVVKLTEPAILIGCNRNHVNHEEATRSENVPDDQLSVDSLYRHGDTIIRDAVQNFLQRLQDTRKTSEASNLVDRTFAAKLHGRTSEVSKSNETASSGKTQIQDSPSTSSDEAANEIDSDTELESSSLIGRQENEREADSPPVAMDADVPPDSLRAEDEEAGTDESEVNEKDGTEDVTRESIAPLVCGDSVTGLVESSQPHTDASLSKQNEDLEDMLSSFVDASPDRDSDLDQ